MAQSLSKLFVHIIFHIKNDSVEIRNEEKTELYSYIGAIIKDNDSIPILINGVKDHIHILCVMSKNIALAKLVEEIKRHSSRWIKTKENYYSHFAWQTKVYITNQEEHHKKLSFREEYLLFLKEYGLEYDERYLWTD
jgi:REP element-mobilizing transposase RayT